MPLTRLDNLYSSKTGKYLYVSPDDFNATDELDNRGNSPLRPFKTIQRAFIEVARYSYVPGSGNDRFDQFSIMLMPGNHYIDNRPGLTNLSVTNTIERGRFFDAASLILTNKNLIAYEAVDRMLANYPSFSVPGGSQNCIDDVLDVLDEITYNLKFGGNDRVYDAANLYITGAHVEGEEDQSVYVFNAARDIAIQVMRNETVTISGSHGYTQVKDTTITVDTSSPVCANVASSLTTLFGIITAAIGTSSTPGSLSGITKTSPETTDSLPIFQFNQTLNEWADNSILDLSNPDNVLYKFNATTGGAIVPRGCSLVGYDLRRTIIRPLYVPDPADSDVGRTSIFNLTGGCYLWQFTIKDGDLLENSPLYNSAEGIGKVYTQPDGKVSSLRVPEFSHHKICIMEYAENKELELYYSKVGKAFSEYQPTIDDTGELDSLVQENRIVGPLSDSRTIDSLKIEDIAGSSTAKVTVTTKIEHGYFEGQYVAVLNTGLDEELNGTFKIYLESNDPKVFSYTIDTVAASVGLTSGNTYDATTAPNALGANAISLAEIDSVESASPYVFNCSIRSTWGQCGMWANGSKATGFRSMVVAQYTGVSLQKDDRAFIRYDRFTNTWNQASLTDAFATVPYHTKGDAYWKDDWRNFHIRASDDAFIQCVSVFAVGFFDHFLMESGGDMSITNSNSNFGNTSLHAVGHKGYAFNQDKGGYITDIIPPRTLSDSRALAEKTQYYTFDVVESNDSANHTRLYLGSDGALNPEDRPAATVGGYRVGARTNEKVYVRLDPQTAGGNTEFNATLSPSGFKRYTTSLSILNPSGIGNYLDNYAQDAANQINNNKQFIQNEAYAYIIDKYPTLDPDDSSFKGGIDISKCKRDIGYIVDAVVTDLRLTLDTSTIPSSYTDTSNINVIQAAEAYYVGGQLDYIENELTETLEAWDYVKNLCIAAMRNWDYLRGPVGGNPGCVITNGSSLINVGDTTGLVIGMTVAEYAQSDFTNGKLNAGATAITTNIPSGAFISEIVNATTIRIANNSGTLNATGGNTNAFLYFDLTSGYYDTEVSPVSDDSIVQDTAYPECGNVSLLIQSYFDDIDTILNGNGNTVIRRESSVNTADLAVRATVFTVNTGSGTSNPHNFETGTPVRLVPRAKAGTNPDKRLIRLPLGFNTNQKYYVIAPGRRTYPEDYSTTNDFNGGDQTKLMLATSPENAAAGIYIFSPETDTIDTNVEIDIYQYVLDGQYDLHKYVCNVSGAGVLETDVSHIFDLPVNGGIPQKVFFRAASDISGSSLPILSGGSAIDDQTFYYARYDKDTTKTAQKKFTIHPTFSDAVDNTAAITFQPNSGSDFYVFCDKRESPLRFDCEKGDTGIWYLNVKDESSGTSPSTTSILYRMHQNDYDDASGKIRTTDSWFERISDTRGKEDRVYRFRYVIPSYLEAVRDPLNGFVMKIRTDDKRRLVPQRLLLKPKGGAPAFCQLLNPSNTAEVLGLKENEYSSTVIPSYDPYVDPVVIETASKLSFSVQSARKVNISGTDYLEITVFDHQTINASLKGKLLYALKITEPQGGTFVESQTTSTASNYIEWTGNSSGNGYIQAVIEHVTGAGTSDWYMILKDVNGTIEYDQYTTTTFSQQSGSVTTTLAAKPDSIGDPDGKSKSLRDDYLYAIPRAGVYTAVPGDEIEVSIQGGGTAQYYIDYVQDVPEIEDTFYIFDIDELQERIAGQQDGIYYLTAVRGNISPFPQGPGVGTNFRNFKFSQPISQLYPLDYKNDPLWFKSIDSTLADPPETISAADNYVHGLVTVNDNKNSETKESTIDFIKNLGISSQFTNTLTDSDGDTIDNRIRAQDGNATSGSEDRKIPIFGDQITPSASKLYVELRRPSIARSGNHTFEYLGFGPGNYSTGFPLRQEVILSDKQDFYAQAKREDGGIVFYTGLNSNGDLYIGNRKINAITGEETFLEAATLESSEDDSDDLGSLVTTFETPVTFQDKITVEGEAFFNKPVEINVDPLDGDSLRIYSKVTNSDDPTLDRSFNRDPNEGDILLTKNRIDAAIFAFNPRGTASSPGQRYTFKTHTVSNSPSNLTPDQEQTFNNNQLVAYGTTPPNAGDLLFKGREVNYSGSLGWIFANAYVSITDANIANVKTFGTNVVRITWTAGIVNANIGNTGVAPGAQIRITDFSQPALNGIWDVLSDGWASSNGYVEIKIQNNVATNTYNWSTESNATLEVSESRWKEVGVLGSESIRTETDSIGDYKVGINTVARAEHSAVVTAFVSEETEPRANLDVVGTTFISGKKILSFTSNSGVTKTETNQNNALLVGGTSDTPNSAATLRVMTNNSGRVGINTTVGTSTPLTDLDRTLTVVGNARITGDVKFESDLDVNGGDIKTTATTFNLINASVQTLNFASTANTANIVNGAETINLGNTTTGTQTISIGNSASAATLNIHSGTGLEDSEINIGNIANTSSNTSEITIGGAFNAPQNSIFKVRNYQTILDGTLEVNEGEIQTNANGTATFPLEVWTRNGTSAYVDAFTRAVQLRLGAVAGTTTIRNALVVNGDQTFNGDVTINGGNNTGQLTVSRAQLGSTASSHSIGNINSLNVDYYRVITEITGEEGIETWVDTAGAGNWSATSTTLVLQTNQNGDGDTDGTVQDSTNGQSPITGLSIGDYLLIDNEIVQIVSPGPGQNSSTSAYEVPVSRGVDCTTAAQHADNTQIYKLDKTVDATYLTAGINATTTAVNVGEFGGAFGVNDYLRLSAGTTCPSGEFVKITAIADSDAKDLRINDGDGNDRFVVDSVCGAVTSTLTSTCDFTIQLTTNNNQVIIASDTSSTPEVTISRDGTLTIVGDGSTTAPAAIYGGTGSASLTGDLLITSTNASDTALNNGRFKLTQSSGDLDIAGGLDMDGTLKIYSGSTGINFTGTPVFQVATDGDTEIAGTLDVDDDLTLGGQINIGGITNYITETGARKWLIIDTTSNTDATAVSLVANTNYFVKPAGSGVELILKLPTSPTTGDMIRIIDIGGNISYDCQLVIRAPSNVNIQGDSSGTKLGTLATAHNGGELIINTPNVGLGLIFVGSTDAAGTTIGSADQGWRLVEV